MKEKSQEQIKESPEEKALKIKLQRWTMALYIFSGISIVIASVVFANLLLVGALLTPQIMSITIAAGVGTAAVGAASGLRALSTSSKYLALKAENALKNQGNPQSKGV